MSSHGLALLVFALLWGMIAFAVAIDAGRRGRSGGVWGVVTFLGGIFGLAVYGIVLLTTDDPGDDDSGTDTDGVRICPECGEHHDDAPNFCGECGAELGPEDDHVEARILKTGSRRYCGNCKSRIGRDADACPECPAVF
ncbi:zinc ribbon domain-containing protein [Haloarcula litorea]|uniref:zinc ribbon domain-containing protein n=1 Tax=Haloarcula litorea TaxID=3032579 RepID=UPI0023E8498F|nr:zinc ribbon domain-containing protein [Halomicroarcula sp. GDY20]